MEAKVGYPDSEHTLREAVVTGSGKEKLKSHRIL